VNGIPRLAIYGILIVGWSREKRFPTFRNTDRCPGRRTRLRRPGRARHWTPPLPAKGAARIRARQTRTFLRVAGTIRSSHCLIDHSVDAREDPFFLPPKGLRMDSHPTVLDVP